MRTSQMSDWRTQDQSILKEMYTAICESEGIKPVPLRFKPVGRGGGVCSYMSNTFRPISITIDLDRISAGSAYVLCHEVAHQIELINNKNSRHDHRFNRTFDRLRKRWECCGLANKLNW